MTRTACFQISEESKVSTQAYPRFLSHLPQFELKDGRYLVRFARNGEELDALLKLRFEVFNLELGEGLESSFLTGRDEDEFDSTCHHLVVFDRTDNTIVGTYRVQTDEMAAERGFYSSAEFDLTQFPEGVLRNSVELGRACIEKSHRSTRVLFLLWKGLAAYVAYNCKRYFFGCCSLTSQDSELGLSVHELLEQKGSMHPQFRVNPHAGMECIRTGYLSRTATEADIPKLFKIYLRFGAKACSAPALDRTFKTIDFLVIFDVDAMDRRSRQMLFEGQL